MAPETVSPEVTRLLGEAAEFRLYGLLFEYPTEAWRAQLTALLPDLRDSRLKEIAAQALQSASEGLHIALFGPAGAVPVREVTYQGGVQFGYLMAELSAYYEAFGYCPSAEEAGDHMAVELGFVAYLRMKQALAVAAGAGEQAETAADAAAAFVKDHLALMAEPVAQKLEAFAPDYLIAAQKLILQHTGPSPRGAFPLSAPLPCGDDCEEMTCGGGET